MPGPLRDPGRGLRARVRERLAAGDPEGSDARDGPLADRPATEPERQAEPGDGATEPDRRDGASGR